MDEVGVFTGPATVRFERLLPGPIERVWQFITDPEKRGLWLAAGPMELKVGGKVELTFRNNRLSMPPEPTPARFAGHEAGHLMPGVVLACEPPRLLRFSWGGDPETHSEVTFELSEAGDRVRLVLTHRRLGERPERVMVGAGWHTHLDILGDRLQDGPGLRFWTTFLALEADYDRRIPR